MQLLDCFGLMDCTVGCNGCHYKYITSIYITSVCDGICWSRMQRMYLAFQRCTIVLIFTFQWISSRLSLYGNGADLWVLSKMFPFWLWMNLLKPLFKLFSSKHLAWAVWTLLTILTQLAKNVHIHSSAFCVCMSAESYRKSEASVTVVDFSPPTFPKSYSTLKKNKN